MVSMGNQLGQETRVRFAPARFPRPAGPGDERKAGARQTVRRRVASMSKRTRTDVRGRARLGRPPASDGAVVVGPAEVFVRVAVRHDAPDVAPGTDPASVGTHDARRQG